MKLRMLKSVAIAIGIAAPAAIAPMAVAQLAVIDVKNLTETTLEASRLLQQINNQIQSLQNEAAMLQNMGQNVTSLNFSSLGAITNDLLQISNLMNQAQGISFNVQSVQTAYQQRYPQSYGAGTSIPLLISDAQTRWQNAHDAFQQTMMVQSQIAQTVQTDASKLADLVNASQGAVGNLQVNQATNQLLALSIKQQLQIQTLAAAQGRAEALKGANDVEAEQEGQAAFATFLGSSNAYTPQ
jgi:P-type conjugative transfer protein TrbJ